MSFYDYFLLMNPKYAYDCNSVLRQMTLGGGEMAHH